MAKKKTIVDDTKGDEDEFFEFKNPKDTLRGYFIEIDDNGDYIFETEDEKTFKLKEFSQLVKALDTIVNGKKVREQEFLLEIEYMGETTRDGKSYQAYRVSIE
jgi:hypothetical protein